MVTSLSRRRMGSKGTVDSASPVAPGAGSLDRRTEKRLPGVIALVSRFYLSNLW